MIIGCLGPKEHSYLMRAGNHSLYNALIPTRDKLAIRDKFGIPALVWGAMTGYEPLVKLVLKIMLGNGNDINVRCGQDGDTALHHAVSRGKTSIVNILLEKGVNIELETQRGETALRLAVSLWCLTKTNQKAYEPIIESLLRYGANIDYQTGDWYAPALHVAIGAHSERMVRLLLQYGADPSIKDRNSGFTPLHVAASKTQDISIKIVRALLQAGSHVNAQSYQNGNTPLHYAILVDNTDVRNILLENGADKKIRNHDGRTPVKHAEYIRNSNIG